MLVDNISMSCFSIPFIASDSLSKIGIDEKFLTIRKKTLTLLDY